MNILNLCYLLIQDSDIYKTETNFLTENPSIAIWSIFNLLLLIGSFTIAIILVLKVLKYLNLKIKLMQKELDKE